jgi:ABC-2 type transport system ATP-binding protein
VSAIVLEGVAKRFRSGWRSHWVLSGLDLEVLPGEVVGLIGANGAGKTTLFKLLAGFISPTRGRVLLLGRDPRQARARHHLAYLPENPRFPEHLTGEEALRYLAAAEGLSGAAARQRVPELLELVDLSGHASACVRHYSKGMVQRLAMAQCLLGTPRVVLLDEPMSGLDPPGRQLMAGLIGRLKEAGATVLVSSHLLSDLERGCTHLAVLKDGSLTKMPLAEWPEAAGEFADYFRACAAGH